MIPSDESFWKQAFLAWASRYPEQEPDTDIGTQHAGVCAAFADAAVLTLQRRQKRGDDIYREDPPMAPSGKDTQP